MRKRFIVFMAILVLLLSMVGCGKTEEPVGNDAEPTITEAVSNDVVNDVEPTEAPEVEEQVVTEAPEAEEPTVTEAPEVEEPTVTEVPEVEEPTVTEAPEVEEPTVTETPEVEEPTVELTLDELRAEKLNYDFEGVYWMTQYGDLYYFDGTYQYSYFTSDYDYDGLPDESKSEYIATDRTYEYVGAGYGFRWWIDGNEFGFCLDGGEEGGDSGAYTEYCTAISKEKAIELFPAIGESEVEEPDVTETPEVDEPEVELSLEDLRTEALNYDFEGVYWMTQYGDLYYFDGTYQYSYFTSDYDYDGLPDESKSEYIATDRTYEYVGAGYGFRWWIDGNEFGFCLDGGEEGGDSGAYTEYCTAISKEKAIELFPAIGEDETEEPVVTESPEVEEPTADDTTEAVEVACDFEDKYWLDDDGGCYHYYSDGKEVREFFGRDTYNGTYVVNGNMLIIDRGGFEVQFKCSMDADGKLYLEPAFTDGFGGKTMVFTEITKDELDRLTQQ